jgi:hypothetical protein
MASNAFEKKSAMNGTLTPPIPAKGPSPIDVTNIETKENESQDVHLDKDLERLRLEYGVCKLHSYSFSNITCMTPNRLLVHMVIPNLRRESIQLPLPPQNPHRHNLLFWATYTYHVRQHDRSFFARHSPRPGH